MTPQILKRTGATTFTRTDFAFKDSVNGEQRFQPYFKFADDTITLDINTSTAGSVTAIQVQIILPQNMLVQSYDIMVQKF